MHCQMKKAMAPHSSTLAWKIPWMEEPDGLQSMGSLESDTTERLHFHFSLSCIGEGHGNPLQCSCLENPRDRGAWWAAVYGVAQSQTRLKRLSSSSRDHLQSSSKGIYWILEKKILCCHNDTWFHLNLTFLKPWAKQRIFLTEMSVLSYVNVLCTYPRLCLQVGSA